MDKHHIKSILEALKSTSSSRIQEALLRIKSKVITNEKGIKLFRDCGGLDHIVPHLRKPNEKILDISLSILGNVCLEEESSLAVGKLNIFSSLVTIIQTVSRDSIIGRACRLIGNLAQKQSNAEGLHAHRVVLALVTLIEKRDKSTSYPTLAMAVRAIRQLWMVTDKRDEMLSLKAVYTVSILLTVECEIAGIIKAANQDRISDVPKKSQEELISGILKCLGYFTTYANPHCAEQIQGDGRGYQCLVALTSTYENSALQCLMNLCYLSTCRPLLGTAGFVESLVGILQKYSETSLWPEGAGRALAHLSGDSVNRSRLRHCGGLRLLMTAARENPHAMHALLQYVFDDISFQILINEGLVGLLTDKLITYLKTMESEHNTVQPENKFKIEPTIQVAVAKLKCNENCGPPLKRRRKQSAAATPTPGDELKVVIERDNMIVGFLDNIDSDATDDSQSGDENTVCKGSKRVRTSSPTPSKKKTQVIKMAAKDWCAGVYWEPKSPEWHSSSLQLPSTTSPDRPDPCPFSPLSDSNNSAFSPEHRGSSNKRARWDWSPESGFSTGEGSSASPTYNEYPWSPGSSGGPASPFSINDNSSDSEISGRYSPVCSEVDMDNEGAVALASNNVVDVTHDLDELIVDDEDSSLQGDGVAVELDTTAYSSSVGCVLVLLFCVSAGACSNQGCIREEPLSNNTLELLTGKECINALLDYVERCRRPMGRAARILAKVFSNVLCLMNILRHRLVLRLHEMSVISKHPPNKCMQCKQILKLSSKYLAQLTNLAESSYGIGEISYQLLKGSAQMKETLTLTLPYIVRSIRPLKKYFLDCNALTILFKIVNESIEDLQHCVVGIAKLASNVFIKDPKILENRFKDQVYVTYDPVLDNLSKDDIVTFELDDLSTVKANKIFLCQNSDVFFAMLMGQFKESAEKRVKLKNVTKPALEHLFTLLHCGINHPNCEVKIFPMANELEINLEVLLLADRFLFEKLKELLCSAILQFQLTPENADKIYIWSLTEGMGFLCVESVAYLLTGKMCELERVHSFKNILRLKYKEQWLDDIKSMISRQLQK